MSKRTRHAEGKRPDTVCALLPRLLNVPPLPHFIATAVFLRTLGLNPSRKLTSAGALAAFYAGSVALAFVAMSYTLWKHSGGTWRSLLCGNGGGDAAACPAGGSGCGGGAAAAGGFGGGAGRVPSAALRSAAEVGAAPQRQARLETASSAHLDD